MKNYIVIIIFVFLLGCSAKVPMNQDDICVIIDENPRWSNSLLDAKKKWIIGSLSSNGTIKIDDGASKALRNGKSLLAAGITRIDGFFKKGENVLITDQNNNQLARGLSSFSSEEINKIKGKQSKEIEKILGYFSKTEIIHKDDMVLL